MAEPECAPDMLARLDEQYAKIDKTKICACGSEHEGKLIQAFGGKAGLIVAFKTKAAYRETEKWRCADFADVANCAHRTTDHTNPKEHIIPDPFLTEIMDLHAIGILDGSWQVLAENMRDAIVKFDEWIALYRTDLPPLEERTAFQEPLLQCLRQMKITLLMLMERAKSVITRHSEDSQEQLRAAGFPHICTLRAPILGRPSWAPAPALRSPPVHTHIVEISQEAWGILQWVLSTAT